MLWIAYIVSLLDRGEIREGNYFTVKMSNAQCRVDLDNLPLSGLYIFHCLILNFMLRSLQPRT